MPFLAVIGTVDHITGSSHCFGKLPVQVLVVFNDQDTQADILPQSTKNSGKSCSY